MEKERFAYDTHKAYMDAVDCPRFTDAANELWDQMEKLFEGGERNLFVVSYNNDKETMFHKKINSLGELAFIAANLFYDDDPEYSDDLDRNELIAFDSNQNPVFRIQYRDLEIDESNDADEEESED